MTRQGTTDLVTDESKWQDWSQGSWDAVTSPNIPNYVAMPASVPAQQVTVNTSNIEKTVIYLHTMPQQAQLTINYLDQDDHNRILVSKQFNGNAGTDANYSTANEIKTLEAAGYTLVSDETNGQDVQIPAESRSYTVVMKHNTSKVSDSKQFTETIHYLYGNGNEAKADHVETATLTREGVKDLVTGATKWQVWSQGNWPAVPSPEISDYTASPLNIPAKTVTIDTGNVETTVIYLQHAAQHVQLTINYLDQDNHNRILASKQFNGDSGEAVGYNTKNDLADFEQQHYLLVTDPTNGTDLTIGKLPETINVILKHDTTTQNNTKHLTETVHYQYADGRQAAPDHVVTLTFNQIGIVDQVTNQTTWQSWTPAQGNFAAVVSPAIAGYTPSQSEIASQAVTGDNQNLVFTVTYSKNGEHQSGQTNQTDNHHDNTNHQDNHSGAQIPESQNNQSQQISGNKASDNPTSSPETNYQHGQVTTQNSENTPSGYRWETIRVLVPDKTSAKQGTLPQTGQKQQSGFIITLLAAILGIFGLALPHRKNN